MNTLCYLSGVGFQELMLIVMFLGIFIALPVLVVFFVIKKLRKKSSANSIDYNSSKTFTPILRNAKNLTKLKSMQEKGVISEQEFEAEKKKLLESI